MGTSSSTAERVTTVETPAGWVTSTTCRECLVPVTLEPTSPERPNAIALSLAGLMVCDLCHHRWETAARTDQEGKDLRGRVAESGLPILLHDLRWEDMDVGGNRGPAVTAARAWAAAKHRQAGGLVLHGPAGTGKTRLAGTAAWARLQHEPVRWVSVAVLITQFQASFSDRDRAAAIKVLTGTGGLVLDDLDKVAPTEQVRSALFAAVDQRITSGSPLLVTTNLPLDRLESRFGEPIVSRIAGYCLGRIFELGGRDRRLPLDDAPAIF
jgi:chromosomal replication initiation ATPase DnaA